MDMDTQTRQLHQYLEQANCVPDVILLKQSTTSTNDDLRELATQGVQTALVCSESQTQGRGQHKRAWVSPQGNIYFSCLIHTNNVLDGRLALEIALNLIHMPIFKDLELSIKWPNDLYSTQGKWGGILVEPLSNTQAVIGVGINLRSQPELTQLDQQTTSLEELGLTDVPRLTMIGEIYKAIQQAAQWFNHGSPNLAQRFNHVAIFKNQPIIFEHQNGQITGQYLGIQNDGALLIQTETEIVHFYQGRLRLANKG
ncbi:biotin--[acetyl-CoA-carboxylase] ligase [Acinetobacter sp. MD2]|nr:biotin--[acetyl-CoA-carboxylase] ligase [Acinetobacter sp. MD2]MEB3767495.1 biotin--[acetyl-CoA-carboxylase] ligase [Acinetobacter sp. MD2]